MTLSPFSFVLSSEGINMQQEKQELDDSVSYFETNQTIWGEKMLKLIPKLYDEAKELMNRVIEYRTVSGSVRFVSSTTYTELKESSSRSNWNSKVTDFIDKIMPNFDIETAKKLCVTLYYGRIITQIHNNNKKVKIKVDFFKDIIIKKYNRSNQYIAMIDQFIKDSRNLSQLNIENLEKSLVEREALKEKFLTRIESIDGNNFKYSLDSHFLKKIANDIQQEFSKNITKKLYPKIFDQLSLWVENFKEQISKWQENPVSSDTIFLFLELKDNFEKNIKQLKVENNNDIHLNVLIDEFINVSGVNYNEIDFTEEWFERFTGLFPDKNNVNAQSTQPIDENLLKKFLDVITKSNDYKHFIQIVKFQSFDVESLKPFYENDPEKLEVIDQLRKIHPNLFTEISLRRKNAQSYEYIHDLIDLSVFTQKTQEAQNYQTKWINSILLVYYYFSLEKIKKEIDQDNNQDKKIMEKIKQFSEMDYGTIASLSHDESFEILNVLNQVQIKYKKNDDNNCNALVTAVVNSISDSQILSNNKINLERINNLIENIFYNDLRFVTLIANIEKANAANGINIAPVAVTEINQQQLDILMKGSVEAKEILAESIIDQENPMDSLVIEGVEAAPLKFIARDRASRFAGSLNLNESPKLIEEIQMDEVQKSPVQQAGMGYGRKLLIITTTGTTLLIIQEDKQKKEQQRIQQQKAIEASQKQKQQQKTRIRPQRQIEDRRKAHTKLENIDNIDAAPMVS